MCLSELVNKISMILDIYIPWLSSHEFHNGLYTESCFVLAEGEITTMYISHGKKINNNILNMSILEIIIRSKILPQHSVGWYEDSVFHVNGFGFPPTEPSSSTRSVDERRRLHLWTESGAIAWQFSDLLPGPTTAAWTSLVAPLPLQWRLQPSWSSWRRRMRTPCLSLSLTCGWTALKWLKSSTWCSRVRHCRLRFHSWSFWDPTHNKLYFLFTGYAAMPPTCFILCGNFSSAPYGKSQLKSLKGETLACLLFITFNVLYDITHNIL